MVLTSLVFISSMQTQIFTTGEFYGYTIIQKGELHTFFQSLNELMRTTFITEAKTYDELINTPIDELEANYGIGDTLSLLAVRDGSMNWAPGSDKKLDLSDANVNFTSKNKSYIRYILPPKMSKEIWVISAKTSDGMDIDFICRSDEDSLRIMNNYARKAYKIQTRFIIFTLCLSFLPIGMFFYFSYIRPLNKLRHAANSIAQGNLDFSIETRGLDEIKDFTKAFENMRHELEESKKREALILENRQQLITNISHDLRTPITSISGYVEGLLDGKGENPERMDRYLKTIKSKTEYLNSMINDLFQFSQIELGNYSLNCKLWNSRELTNSLLEPIELSFEDLDWNLEVIRPFPSAPINVDHSRISQVVENIVQNSLKYTPVGGSIHIEGSIEDHNYVLTFSDTGIGIDKDALPYVFEAFFREDKSRTQSLGGSGLGLSICKKIVEMHGGHMNISSEKGEGTKLAIYLPLQSKL